MNPNENTQIVRIKYGTFFGRDRRFGRWKSRSAKDPDMLFCAKWTGNMWNCVADGYGDLSKEGDYGSGCFSYDGVEIVG